MVFGLGCSLLRDLGFDFARASDEARFGSIFGASGAGSNLGVGLVVRGVDLALFVRRTAAPTALATSPASFKFRCLTPLPGAPGGPGGGCCGGGTGTGGADAGLGTIVISSRGFLLTDRPLMVICFTSRLTGIFLIPFPLAPGYDGGPVLAETSIDTPGVGNCCCWFSTETDMGTAPAPGGGGGGLVSDDCIIGTDSVFPLFLCSDCSVSAATNVGSAPELEPRC